MSKDERVIVSVKKAYDLLDVLAFEDLSHNGLRLSQLAERLQQKPNTLRGILKTMIVCGYVEQNAHGRYRVGRRCEQIGIINQFHMLPHTAKRLNDRLKQLCDETGESVSFYVLRDGERINYTNYQTRDIIKVDYSMLEKNNLYEYPSGRVLVAHCSEEELSVILQKHGYPKKSWNNIVNRAQLDETICAARQEVILSRHSNDNVSSFAAPVSEQSGRLLGTVGVYMPSFRLTREKEEVIREKLLRFAKVPIENKE